MIFKYLPIITYVLLCFRFAEIKCGGIISDVQQHLEIIHSDAKNLIIELPNGKLRGKDNGHYYSYESIPYALPPLGELRFEAPQLNTKKWKGLFDATKTPVDCMQWDQFVDGDYKLIGEEDCLTVNVYRPKLSENKKLPVLVVIHGGAFMFGSVRHYDVKNFMNSGQVIVVKITYRLGPLGFLSTQDTVISGNFGLKDQRLALHWIKGNIAAFGGDPESIMMIGFSAGSASVHLQMLQKEAVPSIVKAAVSLSGTALNPWVITQKSREKAFELAKHLGCPNLGNSDQIKACLKGKSAQDIVSSVAHFLYWGYVPFTPFGPVVEAAETPSAFITQTPEQIIKSGNFAAIPWLVSYTTEDGGYNAAALMAKSPLTGEELICSLNERWLELAPHFFFYKDTLPSQRELDQCSLSLKQKYIGDKKFSTETYFDVQKMFTDLIFKNGVDEAIYLHSSKVNTPIYAYIYDNPADAGIGEALSNRTDINFGTVHCDDLSLIFHYPSRTKDLREDEILISRKLTKMIEDFVKHTGSLRFGDCQFEDNVGQDKLHFLHITKDTCKPEVYPCPVGF